ncbi:hypothetical protein ATE92_0107 [Ulvibacter sp. MAR_2010_11]|nr:hypothetical protein ATE92_0107 [Ulvibacter sp. MAR_2010_11]
MQDWAKQLHIRSILILVSEITRTANRTYSRGGLSYTKDSFAVNETVVFQIKFCGKNPALQVAVKRCL